MGFGSFSQLATLSHSHNGDAGSGGLLTHSHMATATNTASITATNYLAAQGPSAYNGTESALQGHNDRLEQIRKVSARVTIHGSAVDSTVAFRDDGVDVLPITIGAGLTGIFSVIGDVTVAAGSALSWRVTPGAVGGILVKSCERYLELRSGALS